MISETLRFLARNATFFLLGWYVSLGGEATWKQIMVVNWAAMNYIDPIPKMVVCFYAGKTVGLILVGRTKG